MSLHRPSSVFALAGAIAAALAAPAAADERGRGFYFELSPSGSVPADIELGGGVDIEADTGFGATGALGYRFGQGFRLEYEVSFRRNELSEAASAGTAFGVALSKGQTVDGDLSTLAWMLNGYYDIPTGTAWQPYVGGGVGGVRDSFESATLNVDGADAGFAFQGMAGLLYRLSANVWARFGYKYVATETLTIEGTDIDYQAHNFELGLAVGFNAF